MGAGLMRPGQPFCPKNRFSGMWLPRWLVLMDVPWAAKAVYARAANLAGSDGWCSFKVQWMADELGLDDSTVKRSLSTLSARGLLLVERVTGKARLPPPGHRYRFIWHPVMADSATAQNETSEGGAEGLSEERAAAPSGVKGEEEGLGETPPSPPRGGEVIGFGSAAVGTAALRRVPPARRAAVLSVFDAWCESTVPVNGGRRDARLDGAIGRGRSKRNRADLIYDRLSEGWPVEDLRDAVRGWVHSPHHRGVNENGTRYDSLGLLLRDAERIEFFRDLWRAHRPPASSAATQAEREAEEEAQRQRDVAEFWRREREREAAGAS